MPGAEGLGRLLRHKLGGRVLSVIPALMVVESEVLNDFTRFLNILIVEFSAGGAVNLVLKMKEDMIVKTLDMKPTIDAMMRDFCSKSLKRVYASKRDSP
nr:hypothetical protein [Tanacetum cinerariifolium]